VWNLRLIILSIEDMKELLRFLFLSDVDVVSSRTKSQTMSVLANKTKSATSVDVFKSEIDETVQ
jgi:hypothetical protein